MQTRAEIEVQKIPRLMQTQKECMNHTRTQVNRNYRYVLQPINKYTGVAKKPHPAVVCRPRHFIDIYDEKLRDTVGRFRNLSKLLKKAFIKIAESGREEDCKRSRGLSVYLSLK